jgi:NAD(P)-dependent dehydrogenase (short-subunit alcohol dehydrogenase family)
MKSFGRGDARGQGALAGRLILVTGASSGIGYGTARRLAQVEGARVVAVARRRVFRVEALAAQVREQAGEDRIFPLTTDMADRAQAEAVVRQIEDQFGRLDGFIHAVNRALHLTALEVSDHEFDLTMQVNVKSALYGVQAVAPALRRAGTGGIVIYNPTPRETAGFVAAEAVYAAAAHALSALTAGWTRQLDGSGVGVREVAPAPDGDGTEAPTLGRRSGVVTHDSLLVSALHEALSAPAAAPPGPKVALPQFRAPQTLRSHGGLVLKEF